MTATSVFTLSPIGIVKINVGSLENTLFLCLTATFQAIFVNILCVESYFNRHIDEGTGTVKPLSLSGLSQQTNWRHFFTRIIGFDISCKLSHWEPMCIKWQSPPHPPTPPPPPPPHTHTHTHTQKIKMSAEFFTKQSVYITLCTLTRRWHCCTHFGIQVPYWP